jgi:hypothetical protein
MHNIYQIDRDLLLICNLLQSLLRDFDDKEQAVCQVIEKMNQAMAKVFSRSTSLSVKGLHLGATSWLVMKGTTLNKHLLFALHCVVKKRGVKGLFVNIDAATGPSFCSSSSSHPY